MTEKRGVFIDYLKKSSCYFFRCPVVIQRLITSFVSPTSLCNFDSATTNKVLRPIWLDLLIGIRDYLNCDQQGRGYEFCLNEIKFMHRKGISCFVPIYSKGNIIHSIMNIIGKPAAGIDADATAVELLEIVYHLINKDKEKLEDLANELFHIGSIYFPLTFNIYMFLSIITLS